MTFTQHLEAAKALTPERVARALEAADERGLEGEAREEWLTAVIDA